MAKVREFTSGLTHCVGAGLSLVGLVILIIYAAIHGNAFDIVSFTLYGVSLLLLFLFSTLYHWLNIGKKGIQVFKKFNNIMHYLYIAASFTPICFGPLLGPWGWSIFGIIWGIAILGIIFSAIWTKLPRAISITLTFSLIVITLITLIPLISAYSNANLLHSLWWLLISTLLYIGGEILCLLKWPKVNFAQFDFHQIAHIFVILGSICQYWFILNYVTIF